MKTKDETTSDVLFPVEVPLPERPFNSMTTEELMTLVKGMFDPRQQTELPENKEFMEEASDAWEKAQGDCPPLTPECLGNNAEPSQPEDSDVDSTRLEE